MTNRLGSNMEQVMDKPIDETYKHYPKRFFYGDEMEDKLINPYECEWCRFKFPYGVKEHVLKNRLYKVWYDFTDSQDPCSSSCAYEIKYIENVPYEIEELYAKYHECEEKLKKYLLEE